MKHFYHYVYFLFAFFLISCGSDPAIEGEKAFQDGNYDNAIAHFINARKQDPQNQSFDEKIALSYMLRGENLYNKTNNLKSFAGNFEKAEKFIPANPSDNFRKQYSTSLYSLGLAYSKTPPQNEIQKEEFLNKSITYLEDAVFNDEYNQKADSLLSKIKSDNFQKMLDKGKDFYNRAQKQKKIDLYFSAEFYFKKAANFDIYNDEAKNLLSKTREKTLSVLNIQEDLAIAVADFSHTGNNFILDLAIRNYARDPVALDINNFVLSDIDGNTYSLNENMMNDTFQSKKLMNKSIAERETVNGIIVFSVPQKTKIEYIGYTTENGEVVKKYFP